MGIWWYVTNAKSVAHYCKKEADKYGNMNMNIMGETTVKESIKRQARTSNTISISI